MKTSILLSAFLIGTASSATVSISSLDDLGVPSETINTLGFMPTYAGRSLDGELASSESSNVDALLKVALSNKNLLTIKGSILPKSESLKSIFDELNVDLSPNIRLNLSF